MTKEQLQSYRYIKKERCQIEQRLRCLERSPESDLDTIKPLRECYTKKLEELVNTQLEIEQAIETLDPMERDVVRLRYIDGKPWCRIAMQLNYSEASAHRIHRKALAKLKNL